MPESTVSSTRTSAVPAGGRREQILCAALRLFSERGYRQTSTAALAGEVGVSEAALYKHFRSKEEIFAALVDREMQQLSFLSERAGLREVPIAEVLQSLAAQIIGVYDEHAAAMRLILSEGLRDPATAQRLFEGLLAPAADALEEILRRRLQAGELRAHEPGIVAPGFLGMLAFYMMVTRIILPQMGGTGRFSSEDVARELVQLSLHGLTEQAPAEHPAAPWPGSPSCDDDLGQGGR